MYLDAELVYQGHIKQKKKRKGSVKRNMFLTRE